MGYLANGFIPAQSAGKYIEFLLAHNYWFSGSNKEAFFKIQYLFFCGGRYLPRADPGRPQHSKPIDEWEKSKKLSDLHQNRPNKSNSFANFNIDN